MEAMRFTGNVATPMNPWEIDIAIKSGILQP